MSAPILFGRRMRKVHTSYGPVWKQRHGGIALVLTEYADRWFWQVNAWTRNDALRGGATTQAAAVRKLESALRKVARSVPVEPKR